MIECTKGEELWMMIYSKGLEETKFMNLGMYLGNCFFLQKIWMCLTPYECVLVANEYLITSETKEHTLMTVVVRDTE